MLVMKTNLYFKIKPMLAQVATFLVSLKVFLEVNFNVFLATQKSLGKIHRDTYL